MTNAIQASRLLVLSISRVGWNFRLHSFTWGCYLQSFLSPINECEQLIASSLNRFLYHNG